jgi:hypothetical protein
MSAVKGVNYTLFAAGTILDPGAWGSRVQLMYDEYEASGLTAASTITVGVLPAGARLLPQSMIMTDALGTARTLALGDGTTANKFMAATSVAAAGSVWLTAIDQLGVRLAASTNMVLTIAGGTGTGTIKSFIFYAL